MASTLSAPDAWRRSQNCGNASCTRRWDTEGVWEERAYRARRDIAALAAAGLGVNELHAQAIRVIENQVRTEMTCWAAIDPETPVISTMTNGETQIAPEYEPRLAESEYSLKSYMGSSIHPREAAHGEPSEPS